LHVSSSGLVLLAHADPEVRTRVLNAPLRALSPETVTDAEKLSLLLTSIRRRGYVVAPGSIETVSTGIAVPVRDHGEVIAALSGVRPRETAPTPAINALITAARAVEQDLRTMR